MVPLGTCHVVKCIFSFSNTGWTENTSMSDPIQGGQRKKVSD